jgi:AcrR family transcriptional regulator
MGRKKIIDDKTLLAHARTVFLQKGAFGTTKEIAQLAGVSEAVVFQRYPTKAALFLAAMAPPDVDAEAIIATEIADVQAALVETGRRLLGHFRQIIPAAMHLMTHPSVKMSDVTDHFGAGRVDKIAGLLADFLAKKHAEGAVHVENPLAAASMLVASIHTLALYEMMEFHGGDDLEHAVPMFVKALWSGLAPR